MITTVPALGPSPPAPDVSGTSAAGPSSTAALTNSGSGSGSAFHGRQTSESLAGVTGSGVDACFPQVPSAVTGSGSASAGEGSGAVTASSPKSMDRIDPRAS